jgi:Flp pilus assembly pilin Flp
MVEYIIIVVLIAITLIVLFSKLSKATGKKVAGATAALDTEVGAEAATAVDQINEGVIRNISPTDPTGSGGGAAP